MQPLHFRQTWPCCQVGGRGGGEEQWPISNQKQETSDRTGHHQIPAANALGTGQWKVS